MGVRNEFLSCWPYGSKFQVRNVRPSHLEEWLAILSNRVSNSIYNRYAGMLEQAFETGGEGLVGWASGPN